MKLLVREYKRDSRSHVKYLYTTDLSLSEEVEEALRMRWEIEDLQGTLRPWAGGLLVLEEERLQGYLTIFTIMTNVVRELGAEPEERGGVPQVR